MHLTLTSSKRAQLQSITAIPEELTISASAGEIIFYPLGVKTIPLNFADLDNVERSPLDFNFIPEHFFGSHCSKYHIDNLTPNDSLKLAGLSSYFLNLESTFFFYPILQLN
jgi:hypothetical protein